jgi:hypothetical protein
VTVANDQQTDHRQQQPQRQLGRWQFTVVGAAATTGRTTPCSSCSHSRFRTPIACTNLVTTTGRGASEGEDGAAVRVNSLRAMREAGEIARLRIDSRFACFSSCSVVVAFES